MKILHINPYSDNSLYDNLYDIQSKKEDIDVYVPLNIKFKDKALSKRDYKIYSFIFNDFDRIAFLKKQKKVFNDICKRFATKKYNIIHAHTLFSSGYVAYLLNKKYDIPYIVSIQNTDVNFFLKNFRFLKKLANIIMENASRIVYISKPYMDKVMDKYVYSYNFKNFKHKSCVCPYGIDKFWIENKSTGRKMENDGALKILSVGEVNKNKNQIGVCYLCDSLIEKGYKVEYNIVGNIKDKKIYKMLKGKEYVNYLGYMGKAELRKVYNNNDIFILLSKTETFGLVYAEAISQGLPVIYTRGEGFDEQFPDGYIGYSVNLNNGKELLEKVNAIIENYSYLSENCGKAVARFDWETIAQVYNRMYLECKKEPLNNIIRRVIS